MALLSLNDSGGGNYALYAGQEKVDNVSLVEITGGPGADIVSLNVKLDATIAKPVQVIPKP